MKMDTRPFRWYINVIFVPTYGHCLARKVGRRSLFRPYLNVISKMCTKQFVSIPDDILGQKIRWLQMGNSGGINLLGPLSWLEYCDFKIIGYAKKVTDIRWAKQLIISSFRVICGSEAKTTSPADLPGHPRDQSCMSPTSKLRNY